MYVISGQRCANPPAAHRNAGLPRQLCFVLTSRLNILRDGEHFGVNEARKSSNGGRFLTSCSNFKKYPETKSEEFYLKDEPVKVEKRNERPHLTVIEAMVGGWGWGGRLRSRFPDLCSDHGASTLLINPTLA